MNKKEYGKYHIGFREDAESCKRLYLRSLGVPETEFHKYCIHHRDDTKEAIEFNNKYYERFGLSLTYPYVLDFRYITIMTLSEHSKYHNRKN